MLKSRALVFRDYTNTQQMGVVHLNVQHLHLGPDRTPKTQVRFDSDQGAEGGSPRLMLSNF